MDEDLPVLLPKLLGLRLLTAAGVQHLGSISFLPIRVDSELASPAPHGSALPNCVLTQGLKFCLHCFTEQHLVMMSLHGKPHPGAVEDHPLHGLSAFHTSEPCIGSNDEPLLATSHIQPVVSEV